MLKKILIGLCVILVILNIFQYTLVSKNMEFIAKQQSDLISDIKSNLIQISESIDKYNETEDMKVIGGIIVEVRKSSEKISKCRNNASLDCLPVYLESSSLFTEIMKNLFKYSETDKTIDLDALKEGIQYLIDRHETINNGTSDEFIQLFQHVDEIIYGDS